MNAFTIDDVLSWRPCEEYTRVRLKKLFAGKETINEFDVAKMPIPQDHKGWGLGHMLPWDKNFVWPEGVTYLGVLSNAALTSLQVPEGVTNLWVLSNAALTSLQVPEGVTNLRVENNAVDPQFYKPKRG